LFSAFSKPLSDSLITNPGKYEWLTLSGAGFCLRVLAPPGTIPQIEQAQVRLIIYFAILSETKILSFF